MDNPKGLRRSSRQLNDKKVNTTVNEPFLDVNEENKNKHSDELSEEKFKKFLNKVQDDSYREDCLDKIDNHVNNLLESVKLKEKKRKNNKIASETNSSEKIDLTTSDSILTQINFRNIFNINTFKSLPYYYQYKLIKLLPNCDQVSTPEGWINIRNSALNNEFFTKACQCWLDQLKENKFNTDIINKCKTDLEKEKSKLDPFKLKNFEPIWGEKLLSKNSFENQLKKESLEILNSKDFVKPSDECIDNKNNSSNEECTDNLNKSSLNKNSIVDKQIKKREINKKTGSNSKIVNKIELNSVASSPNLSVGSITVRKTNSPNINSISPIQTNHLIQKNSSSSKLFYISNNGKILQLQNYSEKPSNQVKENKRKGPGRKRKIDSQVNKSIEKNYNPSNKKSPSEVNKTQNKSTIFDSKSQDIKNEDNKRYLNDFLVESDLINLNEIWECEETPMIICIQCKAYIHQDCVNNLNICNNCSMENSKLSL